MSGVNKSIGDVVRSGRVKNPQVVRINYTFTYSNQRDRKRQSGGDSIDVPIDATVGDVRELIRQAIRNWWETHYEARDSRGRVPIGDIDVRSLEAL